MAVSITEAKQIIREFCDDYPEVTKVAFKVRDTQEEVFNANATKEAVGTILGAYFPARNLAAFACSNFSNTGEFAATVRHELLGHFGINTFTPDEKRAVLDTIIESGQHRVGSLSMLWDQVAGTMPPRSDPRLIAEEVWSYAAEDIKPRHLDRRHVTARDYQDIVVRQERPLTLEDLRNMVGMVAAGLKDKTRHQQTFPATDNELFAYKAKASDERLAESKPAAESRQTAASTRLGDDVPNPLRQGKTPAGDALSLAEKMAEKALKDGLIRSPEDKAEFVKLVQEGLSSAVERGQKISVPSPQEQAIRAQTSNNSASQDPELPRTPPEKGRVR